MTISEKYGEEMVTPEGMEPEDMDKIGCQVYALLVITEGYKKRMLDWQDSIRSHFGMPVIERDMDPDHLLKEERRMWREELEKLDWPDEKQKEAAALICQLEDHRAYEDMSSFVARKRAQKRTSPLRR